MQIVLYRNNDQHNVLSKSLTSIDTVTGHLNAPCSVENPTITFSYDVNLINANYAYIAAFDRYYYITGRVVDGDTIRVSMQVDPLMSFQSAILASDVIAERSSSTYDEYLSDPYVIGEVGYNYHTMAFPYTFNSGGTYVIITTGS